MKTKQFDKVKYSWHASPLGKINYLHDGKNIMRVEIGGKTDKFIRKFSKKQKPIKSPHRIFEKELKSYFKGKKIKFKTKVKLPSLSKFTVKVLKELKKIPYGKVVSYKGLAKKAKSSKAQRAVGNACGSNPCAIIIPCHRVIKTDGSLGGFTGGLHYKRKLHKIENIKI